MLKAVLDTNIYVSAFTYPRGKVYSIVELGHHGAYHIVVSLPILTETAAVLRGKFGFDDERIVRVIKNIVQGSTLVSPTAYIDVLPDAPDNRILECAVAGQVDLIVSGDRGLLRLKNHQGIGVVSPADFLHVLGR